VSIQKLIRVSLLTLGVGVGIGCNEAPISSEDLDEDEGDTTGSEIELGQGGEALCANGDGVNSAMAALAVAAAKELGRWNPTVDFAPMNYAPWFTNLTATGKARCADGRCWNTQAILDLQKAAPNSVKFGSVVFNANNFVSTLTARWNEQKNCELRGGTGATNCTAEQHKLTFVSSAPGACDTVFTFNATNLSGGNLVAPSQLKNKLMFVGYPSNPYLAFSSTGTTVSIDPTKGLVGGTPTQAGSCSALCTTISSTSVAGACCTCNGVTGKYAVTTWSSTTFSCK